MRAILGLWLLLGASAAVAVPYGATSDLVRDGRIVFESKIDAGEYRLVLSSIKKVNSQWRAKEQRIARAAIARMTLELDEPVTFGEAKRQLQRDMASAPGMTLLFACAGLDCGSSNGWANDFLRVKQLYGMDTNQYYVVQAGLNAGQQETYVVWYLVQRGNGRIYLQQDVINAGPDAGVGTAFAPEVWAEHLTQHGYFVLPGVALAGTEPEISSEAVDLVLQILQKNPALQLRLVGHDYGAGAYTERERRSQFYAQKLRDLLVARGAKADRLSAHGIADLAPAGRRGQARIEVVLSK